MKDASAKPSILVIDDEAGPRESLRFLFKDEYDVVCVSSVDAGLAVLRERRPDVIVLDIKMPGKTGIEGLKEIRALDPQVSVIMLTGFGSLETAQKAIRHGANDYIKKPFDMTEMRDAVRRHILRTEAERMRMDTLNRLSTLNEEMRRALHDKEHLASLGMASSEFVHDLRSPLTVICGYAQLLTEELEDLRLSDPERVKECRTYLEMIEKSAARCQEMSEVWRDLGVVRPERRKPLGVADWMRDTAETVRPAAEERGVRIELQLPDASWKVTGDALQLFRALQNLAVNAIQAVPERGGVVTLRALAEDRHVVVMVCDNGPGIPEEILEDVFKPHVSTRQSVGGSGLGLFIAQQIMNGHGGFLRLENQVAGGVAAYLRLPRNPGDGG